MISEFIQYLQTEKRYSLNTIESYRNDLSSFDDFVNNKTSDLSEITFQDIRSWIISLKESNYSNRSINRKITTLRSFFKFLIKKGRIADNPAKRIQLLKIEKNIPDFVNESQIEFLLDDFSVFKDYKSIIALTIFELFYSTGIRVSELTNVKDIDINFSKNTIKVLGKRNKERIIPISPRLLVILKNYQFIKNEELKTIVDKDYYFLTLKGKKLYNKFVYNLIFLYLSRVTTIKKKSPHVMRHTFATHMLNKGADLNSIKEILGHSSLAATQVYTHNSIEKLLEVYKQAHPKA